MSRWPAQEACVALDVARAIRRRVLEHHPEHAVSAGQGPDGGDLRIAHARRDELVEAALVELSPFLSTSASVAVLIDSREIGAGQRIREKLEQMGFRIEAGVRCQEGFVLSAIRHGFGQMENAA